MGLFSSIGGILGGVVGLPFGPIGAVVGAGLGGAVGGSVDANQANKKAQGYYNQQMSFAQQQAQFQQDYVKNMMQWRVEDAKNAGVHPMAALGVSNPSYSPVSAPSAPEIYDSSQFDTGSTFGQSLNRASMQAKTQAQQEKAASLGFQQIDLQNQGLSLDNQYKALQIAQLTSELQRNAASSAPAPSLTGQVPGGIDGQPDSLVNPEPMTTTPHTVPGKEPGSNPSSGWLTNEDGSVSKVQSREAKNRLEEDMVGGILWNVNNRLVPHVQHMFGGDISEYAPPVELLPKGAAGWMYSGAGDWIPVDSNGKPLNPLFLERVINGAKSSRMRSWFKNLSKVTY